MKNKIITFLFCGYLSLFGIMHICLKDQDISYTERRKLTIFPTFQLNNEYITKVEKYLLDHFPARDTFRSLKAIYNFQVLRRLENNGIHLVGDNVYKTNYPTDPKSIDNFITKIEKIKESFSDNQMYLMVVPDKNYYLHDKNFLHIDYGYIYEKLNELGMKTIDLRKVLYQDDYYKTDTHWKQENLDKVVKQMSEVMNFNYQEEVYNINEYNNFYGVYYGESALKSNPEKIVYLTNDIINNANVKYLENPKLSNVYNLDKLKSMDSYEVFLDGASSFIEITNPNFQGSKELIIFRDSFSSSLTPLLIKYYSKITLIDNRYINSDNYTKLLTIDDQDILFLYSTLLINNSSTLKG